MSPKVSSKSRFPARFHVPTAAHGQLRGLQLVWCKAALSEAALPVACFDFEGMALLRGFEFEVCTAMMLLLKMWLGQGCALMQTCMNTNMYQVHMQSDTMQTKRFRQSNDLPSKMTHFPGRAETCRFPRGALQEKRLEGFRGPESRTSVTASAQTQDQGHA